VNRILFILTLLNIGDNNVAGNYENNMMIMIIVKMIVKMIITMIKMEDIYNADVNNANNFNN